MSTAGSDHSILVCVTELTRLYREGNIVSSEAFGHIVDILEHIRSFTVSPSSLSAPGLVMPMSADDEHELDDAVHELAVQMGNPQTLIRRRPSDPAAVLPARGVLLQLILQMLQTWASDPENQQKLLDWLFGLFGGSPIVEQ